MEEEEVLTLRPLFEETLVEPTNQLELDFGPGRHVQFFFEFKQLKGANGCDSDDWFIVRAIWLLTFSAVDTDATFSWTQRYYADHKDTIETESIETTETYRDYRESCGSAVRRQCIGRWQWVGNAVFDCELAFDAGLFFRLAQRPEQFIRLEPAELSKSPTECTRRTGCMAWDASVVLAGEGEFSEWRISKSW